MKLVVILRPDIIQGWFNGAEKVSTHVFLW